MYKQLTCSLFILSISCFSMQKSDSDNPWNFIFTPPNYAPVFNINFDDVLNKVYGSNPRPELIPNIEDFHSYHAHYGAQKYIEARVAGHTIVVMVQDNNYGIIDIDGKPYALEQIQNATCTEKPEFWVAYLFCQSLRMGKN